MNLEMCPQKLSILRVESEALFGTDWNLGLLQNEKRDRKEGVVRLEGPQRFLNLRK
jgi:hypothetical protein